MTKLLLGIDPGLRRCGWSAVLVEDGVPRLHSCGVFKTEKSAKKLNVLASSDNVRRCRELWTMLEDCYLDNSEPGSFMEDASCICVESQSWPRSASSSAKTGMAWGVLSAWAECHQIPLVQASPQQIKFAATGKGTASKQAVAEGLAKRPGFENLPALLDQLNKGDREHAADATGAVVACLGSDLVRACLR